jgi:SAM-dependent methyltransferase
MGKLRLLHREISARLLRLTREQEIEIVLDCLRPYLNYGTKTLSVLEFGAGNCYQAATLSRVGSVIATDRELHPFDRDKPNVRLVTSSIDACPFKPRSFDLIFSNHVIEHIPDLAKGLAEVSRLARADGVFAFTVPTRCWLLFAQPAHIGWRLSALSKLWQEEGVRGFSKLFMFSGHGEYPGFCEAYKAFGISNWTTLLQANGFAVLKRVPLLAYAPAELLLPPSRNLVRFGICSSVLFVLKRARSAVLGDASATNDDFPQAVVP